MLKLTTTVLALNVALHFAQLTPTPRKLPLKQGEYQSGACDDARTDNRIGVYDLDDSQFVTPRAEGRKKNCHISRLTRKGAVITGVADCQLGVENPTKGDGYGFTYTIRSLRAFSSKGVVYNWCFEHE